jgi:hypothetical protein
MNSKSDYLKFNVIEKINNGFVQNSVWKKKKPDCKDDVIGLGFNAFVKCFCELYDMSKGEISKGDTCSEILIIAAETLQTYGCMSNTINSKAVDE